MYGKVENRGKDEEADRAIFQQKEEIEIEFHMQIYSCNFNELFWTGFQKHIIFTGYFVKWTE